MKAVELVNLAIKKGAMIATAESCTGGMVAAAITDVAGSSAVFDRGFVTYSNEAKTEMLGVPTALIARHGAVSPEVARAMSEGAISHSRATVAVAITGIAGPGGGSAEKPVGLVHFACTTKSGLTKHKQMIFSGDRETVRQQARDHALQILANVLVG